MPRRRALRFSGRVDWAAFKQTMLSDPNGSRCVRTATGPRIPPWNGVDNYNRDRGGHSPWVQKTQRKGCGSDNYRAKICDRGWATQMSRLKEDPSPVLDLVSPCGSRGVFLHSRPSALEILATRDFATRRRSFGAPRNRRLSSPKTSASNAIRAERWSGENAFAVSRGDSW